MRQVKGGIHAFTCEENICECLCARHPHCRDHIVLQYSFVPRRSWNTFLGEHLHYGLESFFMKVSHVRRQRDELPAVARTEWGDSGVWGPLSIESERFRHWCYQPFWYAQPRWHDSPANACQPHRGLTYSDNTSFSHNLDHADTCIATPELQPLNHISLNTHSIKQDIYTVLHKWLLFETHLRFLKIPLAGWIKPNGASTRNDISWIHPIELTSGKKEEQRS